MSDAAPDKPTPPAGPPGGGPRPLLGIDPRFHAPLLITGILVCAHLTSGILESPGQTMLAILAALVVELSLGKVTGGYFPHLASSYITGISVGVLIRAPGYWPFALTAAISIMSKYVIRLDGRHVWNPSNFGVSWMVFVYPMHVAHLSIQWGNALWALAMVWSLGSIVIYRLKRFHICVTYVFAYTVLAMVRTYITGDPMLAELAPITGPMYQLFIFYMITDPRTTVRSKSGQCLTVVGVALLEAVFRVLPTFYPTSRLALDLAIHAPIYALFLVGPCFLMTEILRDRARRLDAARASP